MSFIDIFTWIVFLIMIASLVGIFVFMGLWPGKVAQQRHHPQADAIKIGSWVALIMGFVVWPVVLVWAYTRPPKLQVTSTQAGEDSEDFNQKIAALESRIAQLESGQLESNQGGAQ